MAYTDTKTPIVYYGGKTAILNHIFPLVPEHEVYTECFAGGAALFWSKRPTIWIHHTRALIRGTIMVTL